MSNIKNAVFFSFLGKHLNIVVQLVGTMILTRILSPEDYGLYTIAYIFILFSEILREFGVTNYLIKEKELTQQKIASSFALLLLSAGVIAPVMFLLAAPIASFYDEPKLTLMLQLLSINLLLTPFGSIVRSLLVRNLNFKAEALCSIVSQVLSILLMIYLAYEGYEELTLVYGAIANTFFTTLLLQFYRPENLPKLPSLKGIGDVFHFSKFVGLASIIGQLGHHASELIVGKYYSMATVGQLNRGSSTAGLFNKLVADALSPVITPYISQINRESNSENVKEKIGLLTNIQLNLSWPFFVLVALLAEPIVLLLFGEQWIQAAVFLALFCLDRFIFSFTQHLNPILLGMGLVKELMKAELLINIIRIAVILAFVQQGVVAMVLANALVTPISRTIYFMFIIKQKFEISPLTYFKDSIKPLLSTLATAMPVSVFLLYNGKSVWDNTPLFLISLLLTVAIWLLCVKNQPFGQLIKQLRTH